VRLPTPPEHEGSEAPPVAPVRDRALRVAVPRFGAVGTRVWSVVGAAEHAAESVATHLIQPHDGVRVALRRGQRELLAGEEQLDGVGEESLAEHLAELVLRRVVAVTS
jgi:hypothetical protein